MRQKRDESIRPMTGLDLLQVLLIVLKLMKKIDLAWIWILAPMWIWIVIVAIVYLVTYWRMHR